MFGDKSAKKSAVNQESFSANTIQNGTIIQGQIVSEGSIRIDGKLEGSLSTKGKLVIGASGSIRGNISCGTANIEGKVIGDIEVGEMLILKQSAVIDGDISTQKLVVEEGAVFNGRVSMGNRISKAVLKNEEASVQRQAV